MAPFKGFHIGHSWEDYYGNSYEITARYVVRGHRYYHVKLNGKHICEKFYKISTKLIPEQEVLDMKK